MNDRTKIELLKLQRESMYFWSNFVLQKEDINTVLSREIAPGKNHGVWLLGHLVVSDDDIGLYLETHERQFPELVELFGNSSKCEAIETYPEPEYLLACWEKVCEQTLQAYDKLKDSDLEQPHGRLNGKSVDEDFFGTKQNVLLHWLNHQLYHVGQISTLSMR